MPHKARVRGLKMSRAARARTPKMTTRSPIPKRNIMKAVAQSTVRSPARRLLGTMKAVAQKRLGSLPKRAIRYPAIPIMKPFSGLSDALRRMSRSAAISPTKAKKSRTVRKVR